MPVTADEATRTEETRPTGLVRAAVDALARQFFEPLAVDDLLRDVWAGAAAALVRATGSFVPPRYPDDPARACAVHEATFPTLERLASGYLGLDELATAALEELLAQRRDGHTFLSPRGRFWGRAGPDQPDRRASLELTHFRGHLKLGPGRLC